MKHSHVGQASGHGAVLVYPGLVPGLALAVGVRDAVVRGVGRRRQLRARPAGRCACCCNRGAPLPMAAAAAGRRPWWCGSTRRRSPPPTPPTPTTRSRRWKRRARSTRACFISNGSHCVPDRRQLAPEHPPLRPLPAPGAAGRSRVPARQGHPGAGRRRLHALAAGAAEPLHLRRYRPRHPGHRRTALPQGPRQRRVHRRRRAPLRQPPPIGVSMPWWSTSTATARPSRATS